MHNMKVAITGVSSRIGAEFVSRMDRDDAVDEIVGIDIVEPKHLSKKLRFIKRDVRDDRIRGDVQGCDALAHLAFLYQPPLPPQEQVYAINVDGSRNIFDSAIGARVGKIVFVSSVAAYGSFSDNPVPISEEHPIRLMTPPFYYNECKYRVERYLDELEATHKELVVTRLRPCTVASRSFSHVLNRRIYFDPCPEVPVQFVWIDDVVEAFFLAMMKHAPGAFNIAGDSPLHWREIAAIAGRRCLTIPYRAALWLTETTFALGIQKKVPPGWIRMSRYPVVLDCTKAKRVLGWAPRYDTGGAIKEFFEHQRQASSEVGSTRLE